MARVLAFLQEMTDAADGEAGGNCVRSWPPFFGTFFFIVRFTNKTLPIGSMGLVYYLLIYHKNQLNKCR